MRSARQFMLGPGTKDGNIIAPQRRALVSKAAGWISPVLVFGGRVVGVWEAGDTFTVTLFPEAGPVPGCELAAEATRMAEILGTTAELIVKPLRRPPDDGGCAGSDPSMARGSG